LLISVPWRLLNEAVEISLDSCDLGQLTVDREDPMHQRLGEALDPDDVYVLEISVFFDLARCLSDDEQLLALVEVLLEASLEMTVR